MYENLTFDEYVAIDAINASTLKPWLISPRYARFREQNPQETDAMILGRAVHSYLLDDDFHDQYASLDDTALIQEILNERPTLKNVRNCKEYKEAHARWVEVNQGKTILKPDQYATVIRAKNALYSHKLSRSLDIENKQREVSLVWHDPDLDALCKARLDLFDPRSGLIDDIKTIAKRPTARVIEKQCIEHAYHIQYAWYMRGVRQLDLHQAPTLRFIFIQTCDEFDVTFADPLEDMLDQGWADARLAFEARRHAIDADLYPGIHPDPVQISLPAWAFDEHLIDDGVTEVEHE